MDKEELKQFIEDKIKYLANVEKIEDIIWIGLRPEIQSACRVLEDVLRKIETL